MVSMEMEGEDTKQQPAGKESAPDDYSDKQTLVEEGHRVSLKEAVGLRIGVLVVSWISVICLFILGVTSFVIGQLASSSAAFAFALDAILDTLSSAVVIWRYTGNSGNLYSIRRECIACIVLGALFLVSAVCIIVKAAISLAHTDIYDPSDALFYLALVNGVVCTLLVIAKVYLGYKLESRAIITDALNSLVGAVLAFTIMMTNKVSISVPGVWIMDPIIGLICAAILLIYGIWTIIDCSRRLMVENAQEALEPSQVLQMEDTKLNNGINKHYTDAKH